MASSVIHMAVASEVNKIIKKDYDKLLIGSITPDISKTIGETKIRSHFLDNEIDNIPNLQRFLAKYKKNLNDDFVLGYYIHLFTDYLWFKYFIPEIQTNDYITKIDGTKIKCTEYMFRKYIYNDYTNLNKELIDEYKLDLSVFYKRMPKLNKTIEEIPMDKIKLIIDKSAEIIEKSKVNKDLIFDIKNIKKFIETSTELTIANLKELGIK